MSDINWVTERQTAMHLLRSGRPPEAVAQQLGRSLAWVYKVRQRFAEAGWAGLAERSRAPRHRPTTLSAATRQAILAARSALEAQVGQGQQLQYIGAQAIQAHLRAEGIDPLPGTASIERVVARAGMTRSRCVPQPEVRYPHVRPTAPLQLCQVDIVPHFLTGGQAVACFNALDVVSRYPTSQAWPQRRSAEALAFLLQVWTEIGLPTYTQVDNESCFSGGVTHPGVVGQVVRLALWVGTELIFSPLRHPESNGYVERFHQDYNQHVWATTALADVEAVQAQGRWFIEAYRQSAHHSALGGRTPSECHALDAPRRLTSDAHPPAGKVPLTEGRVHFMRRVTSTRQVRVLNLAWDVPKAAPDTGVWVTLDFTVQGATLYVYDTAPDVPTRLCLARHPFPLSEVVQPRPRPDRSAVSAIAVAGDARSPGAAQTRAPHLNPSFIGQLADELRFLLRRHTSSAVSTMS